MSARLLSREPHHDDLHVHHHGRSRATRARGLRALDLSSARVVSMQRSTEPTVAETAVSTSPHDAEEPGPPPGPVLRFSIDSWEILGGSPRPVVGQPLDGFRVICRPCELEDPYGLAALDEDIDVDALPPQVAVPPEARGGVRRGHLHAEWHVTPSEGALFDAGRLSGLVVRTRIISLDRRLEVVEGLGPAGEAMEVWSAIPGTLRLREVCAAPRTTGVRSSMSSTATLGGPSPPVYAAGSTPTTTRQRVTPASISIPPDSWPSPWSATTSANPWPPTPTTSSRTTDGTWWWGDEPLPGENHRRGQRPPGG